MSDLKTKATDSDIETFLSQVEDPEKRADCYRLLKIFGEATGAEPVMWGNSIIGFGEYHYCHGSGRKGDWFLAGFSPRKQQISVYIMTGFSRYEELMGKLGKHKTGKACLYIKRLSDVEENVLTDLVALSVEHIRQLQN